MFKNPFSLVHIIGTGKQLDDRPFATVPACLPACAFPLYCHALMTELGQKTKNIWKSNIECIEFEKVNNFVDFMDFIL